MERYLLSILVFLLYPVVAQAELPGCLRFEFSRSEFPSRRQASIESATMENCQVPSYSFEKSEPVRIYVLEADVARFCADRQIRAEYFEDEQAVFSCLFTVSQTEVRNAYKWRDEAGNFHITQAPPPKSCQSEDCQKIFFGEVSEDSELHRRIAEATKGLDEDYKREEVYLAEEKERRARQAEQEYEKKYFLSKGVVICDTFTYAEQYFEAVGMRDSLLRRSLCLRLPQKVRYTVAGRTLSNFVPVFIEVGSVEGTVWVHRSNVHQSREWK